MVIKIELKTPVYLGRGEQRALVRLNLFHLCCAQQT